MKSSKTSFLRNCISGWNVRFLINGWDIWLYDKFWFDLHYNTIVIPDLTRNILDVS